MNPFSAGLGILYLVHWFVVIPWVTLKMALLPKRLVWVKTLHLGQEHGQALPEGSTAEDGDQETEDLATEVSQA